MFFIRCSQSSEQLPKTLHPDGDFIPRDRRSIAEERERREPIEVEHLTGLQVANRTEIQVTAEGGRTREHWYLSWRGGRPYMRRRRAVASTNRTRTNASAAVHVRYDIRRTTPRRPTLPSRRRHSSSYRNRSDKCTAVAADDVSAILQNDDRLDHPAGRRRRLSRWVQFADFPPVNRLD